MTDEITPGTGGFIDPGSIVGGFGVQQGMKIADFGAGSGYFTILLGQLVGEGGVVVALDVLDSALDTIRSKTELNGLNNIRTVRADLEVLGSTELSDESQDIVLMANILFQSQKKEEISREAHRILVPNGKLFVIDWKKGAGGGPPDNLRLLPGDMQRVIEEAGFNLESSFDAGYYHYGLKFIKR